MLDPMGPLAPASLSASRLNADETYGNTWVNMANEDPDYTEAAMFLLFPARTMIIEATL